MSSWQGDGRKQEVVATAYLRHDVRSLTAYVLARLMVDAELERTCAWRTCACVFERYDEDDEKERRWSLEMRWNSGMVREGSEAKRECIDQGFDTGRGSDEFASAWRAACMDKVSHEREVDVIALMRCAFLCLDAAVSRVFLCPCAVHDAGDGARASVAVRT